MSIYGALATVSKEQPLTKEKPHPPSEPVYTFGAPIDKTLQCAYPPRDPPRYGETK
jgi:hypothetical protein